MHWIAKGHQEFNFFSTIRITLAHPGSPHLGFTLINFPRTNIWKLPTPGPLQPIHSPAATEELPSASQELSTAPEAGEGSLLLLQTHLSSNGMSSVSTPFVSCCSFYLEPAPDYPCVGTSIQSQLLKRKKTRSPKSLQAISSKMYFKGSGGTWRGGGGNSASNQGWHVGVREQPRPLLHQVSPRSRQDGQENQNAQLDPPHSPPGSLWR